MTNFHDVKGAVDGLCSAFEAFKAANDQRLREVERKGAADPMTLTKVDRLNGTLNRLEDRFDTLETAMRRSPLSAAHDNPHARTQAKAFIKFLRKGDKALEPHELKALTVSQDTTGGYLAPVEYTRELIRGETEFSPMRLVARVRQTSARAIQAPKRTGQFAAQWTSETGTRSETTGLTYGLEEIPTHEMYALVDISQQDLEDSAFDLEAELGLEFAEQFAVAEGLAFVSGNGVGRPEGFLTHSDVASDNSGSAAAIADANGQANGLIDLYHNLKTAYARNGSWVLNRKTLGEVRKLKDADNNYIWQPGLANGVANSILGTPYVEVPDMPDVAAAATPIAFGDLRRGYLIVDRIEMSILRDPYTQATSGNVRFIARRRVGSQVVLAEAIRKLTCAA